MKTKINLIPSLISSNWAKIAVAVLMICIVLGALLPTPQVLNNRMNKFEVSTIDKINNYDLPWSRAVNAPYILPSVAVNKFKNNSLESARLVSLIFSLLSSVLFYVLIRKWLSTRMAIIGTIIFSTNSLIISGAHQAISLSLSILLIIAMMTLSVGFIRTKKRVFSSLLSLFIVLGISAYIPFLFLISISLIIFLIINYRNKIKKIRVWQALLSLFLYLAIISPLLISIVSAPGQIKELIGISGELITVQNYINNLLSIILSINIYSPVFPEIYLGNLPILDVFTSAIFLLGSIYFANRIKYKKNILAVLIFIIILFSIALSNTYQLYLMLLIPLVYLLSTIGVLEIIKKWFEYFPRNPLARSAGIILISVSVGLVSFYQINRYHVAWANSPQTKSAYMIEYKEN